MEHKMSDKETILDEYSITISNKTDESKQPPKRKENFKQMLLERSRSNILEGRKEFECERETKDGGTFHRNNNTQIPFVHQKADYIDTKRRLDNFAMIRKKSHLTTIDFDFNIPTRKVQIALPKPIIRQTNHIQNLNSVFRHPDISHVVKRQNALLDRLDRMLREEIRNTKALRHSDASLLADLEKLKTMKAMKQVVITPTRKMSTVLTVIDETAVREALKKDPLVRRILEMGKHKRIRYTNEVKQLKKN